MIPEAVTPVLAPADVQAQYDAYRVSAGAAPDPLACDPLWEDVVVCFEVAADGHSHWVTAADLRTWGVDVKAVRAEVTTRAKKALDKGPERFAVEGMPNAKVWTFTEGDWTAASVLLPELVGEKIGAKTYAVATPVIGVVFVWIPGDPDVDKVIGVGAKEMFDTLDNGVTATLHLWDGKRWSAWAEAVKKP
jgi:hypothetical protein